MTYHEVDQDVYDAVFCAATDMTKAPDPWGAVAGVLFRRVERLRA